MKKQLFVVALFAAVISLASCGGQPGGSSSLEGISVSPKELNLNENEMEAKLGVKFIPADAKQDKTVAWSSSDTTVAIVSEKGLVQATGYGECYIYAQVDEFKDSCYVKVTTYYESLMFTGACIVAVDTTYALDTITGEYKVDTVKASSGETFYCYRSLATIDFFSDGFYINGSGYLDGSTVGTLIEMDAPIYYGTKYLNPDGGVIFSLGEWVINDTAHYSHESKPGEIDEDAYIAGMTTFIDGFNAGDQGAYITGLKAAGAAFKNPYLDIYTYDSSDPQNTGYVHPYVPSALCTQAEFSVNQDYPASDYMYGLDYSIVSFKVLTQDNVFGENWGLNLSYNEETETVSLVDESVTFYEPITVNYGSKAAKAPTMKAIKNPFILNEHPEIEARVKAQLDERKAVVLKRKH